MDFVSKYQGVVGRVFGNDNSTSDDDSYVERLLDRISNGTLADDRRNAMAELQSIVTESHAAQLAFGAMGFPVLLSVLKEERDDVEMLRGAIETLVSAVSPTQHPKLSKNEVQPALMNSDLLSREVESISLLLSLLSEEDFYIRYYTLQLLTALLTKSPTRLQEAILTIPRGITRLVDMLMDREVIRNEALLLLTYLTREAEEIQKILVFEGAFEKIFSIINEEGGSEGGVVVQDCLELLNNLLRNNTSNQVLLRETIGFDPLVPILKLRGTTYKFTQQKTINLLSVLDTITLLVNADLQTDSGRDSNGLTNRTVLVQKRVLDHLLMLGVESQWAPVSLRCMALRCIADLVINHAKNCDALASKLLGEEPQVEPALNSILRIILRASSTQEFVAADYVLKNFCEKNPDGQSMLVSSLHPQSSSTVRSPFEEDVHASFGSMLLNGLTSSESDDDLQICCRAASVLSHLLKDNIRCKEMVLQVELEAPTRSLGGAEPLMHRLVKYLVLVSSKNCEDGKASTFGSVSSHPVMLKLLIIWLFDCPPAVECFLDSHPHLTYLLELVSDQNATVCVRGLAAVLLGECISYNKTIDNGKNAFSIVDAVSQKIGLTSYFSKFNEMQNSSLFTSAKPSLTRKPLSRSNAASMSEIENVEEDDSIDPNSDDYSMLAMVFDSQFVDFVKRLDAKIREQIVEIYSHPKTQVAVVPAELEQKSGEIDEEYIQRLKRFVEKQCLEIQELLSRNATLAEDLARVGGSEPSQLERKVSAGTERVQVETLRRDLHETSQRLEAVKAEKIRIEAEASMHQSTASKMESDLKSLSAAYNSLEEVNFQLEREVKALKGGGSVPASADVEAIKAEARKEAQRESEAELNDLLVCLGQEQSKVEKLSARLSELGVDAATLLDGIGEDMGLDGDGEDEED
ncbi:golgin candidate 6-like [Salvia splendens]|uniref:golgin candidate 6-like n=1 Tax=Salvia splendens TaxID=180675 RepID=UPI001C259DA0|nr:golgin candidate 6-like [Salvia splendens]